MKKKLFYIFIPFFISSVLHAQSVNYKIVIDGYVKDSQDTCYPVKNAKIKLIADNGITLDLVTDSTGYYVFRFENYDFKKADVVVETSKYTTSKIWPKFGYLASREIGTFHFTDPSKNYRERKMFFITPVTACPRFPVFVFKKNSLVLDTIPKEFLDVDDPVFIYPNLTLPFLAQTLKDFYNYVIQISGHCSGDENNIQALSLQRADKIRTELIKLGIDEKRLVVKGLGDTRPVYYNSKMKETVSKESKELQNAQSRRCTIGAIRFDHNVIFCSPKTKSEEEE